MSKAEKKSNSEKGSNSSADSANHSTNSLQNSAVGLDPNTAVKSFFRDPQWILKTGIGGLFNITSFILCAYNYLFIPVAFLMWGVVTGYVLRAARMHMNDRQSGLPDWNDWADLVISGLTWMAIYTGQLIFFFTILSTLMVVGLTTGMVSAQNPLNLQWSLGTLYGLSGLGLMISLNSSFLMINMAQEEQLTAAFAVNTVISKIAARPADFILAWLLSVGIQLFAFAFPMMTVAGAFFLPSLWFIGQILSALVLAQAWSSVPRDAKDINASPTAA